MAIEAVSTLLYIVLGITISTVATMAGIGGGAFMVPLFYFMGLEIHCVVGTSKFVIMFLSLIGAINYLKLGKVRVKTGLLALIGMMPMSYLGAYLSNIVDKTILKVVVSIFIICYGIRLIYSYFRTKYIKNKDLSSENKFLHSYKKTTPAIYTIAIGGLAGLIAGLTGTGGGVINVPLFISILGLPIHNAVATSTFIIFPSATIATARHILGNDIVYSIGIPFAIGSVIGALIGPRIAVRLSVQKLKLFIAIVILIAGIRMIAQII